MDSTADVPQRIAFLGNFPPRLCGIATFTQDICEAVSATAPSALCYVAAVNDHITGYDYPPRVRIEIQEKDLDGYRRAAELLNFDNVDVLSLQHEFGIFGGPAGSHILALLNEVRMPVVSTLHTVPLTPNDAQRMVMEQLIEHSDRLVVMAKKGVEILEQVYQAPAEKIDLIAHGIPDIPFTDGPLSKTQFGIEDKTVLLTFGLIGPGKGLEHVIQAMPDILNKHPDVVYLILGATHPHLVAQEGERYRLSLQRLADELGVKEHVIFYNRFVSQDDLIEFIQASDIYVTPYINEHQITSGALAYAFGAGKAVISTPYWHACELLEDGRGTLVPFADPPAIAAAVARYLDDPALMTQTRTKAYEIGRSMIWPAIATRYMSSFQHACADRGASPRSNFAKWTLDTRPYKLPLLRIEHIKHMTDATGIFQHAIFNVPDYHHGYCIDDNARAFILCNYLEESGSSAKYDHMDHLATIYLAFLAAGLNNETNRFRNFMTHGRNWLEAAGSEDSHGRAMWALGTGAGRCLNEGRRRLSADLFMRALPATASFSSPRAWAFTILGIIEYKRLAAEDDTLNEPLIQLMNKLTGLWHNCADDTWPWFESCVTYENARLSQAMILSGQLLNNTEAYKIGLRSLEWLTSIQITQAGHYRPIGSNGFYDRGGSRADFDQQPVEAQAMVSACLAAFRCTKDRQWLNEAHRAFEWFLGRNDLGVPIYDAGSGACNDGLHQDRVNENQGAESTLAFHLALAELNDVQQPLVAPA